jgi:hypothetical protein
MFAGGNMEERYRKLQTKLGIIREELHEIIESL